jgi:hypothetical protein
MRVRVFEADFVHRQREPRYFVMRYGPAGNSDGYPFEV